MKHFIFLFAAIMFSLVMVNESHAAPDKAKTKNFLLKTNRALGVAHMTVKKTKKYDGKLALAVRHQRYARKQYIAGNYQVAVYHSRRARLIAAEIMKNNNAKTNTDFALSADENTMSSGSPADTDLEAEVTKDDPAVVKDEDLMNGNLDLNVQ
jgi:hypothetical protein